MEVARGAGEEAVCAVLGHEQERSEPTEVSQQLWFVNRWSGRFSGHNYAIILQ